MTIAAATLTGPVDLLDPDPATITLPAMAHQLGKLDRWAGALELPFSVAQHSLLVREIYLRIAPPPLTNYSLWALKHDGHEYLIGDITRPAEKLLGEYDAGFSRRLAGIKRRLDRAIDARFRLPAQETVPTDVGWLVEAADLAAAHLEWKALMPAANGPSPFLARLKVKVPSLRPKPMSWADAADAFRDTFERELAERAWERLAA